MPQPQRHFDRLNGKVALITGAGSQGDGFGTGKAIAYVFAMEGARVCLVDNDQARMKETQALITRAGGDSFCCAGSVTDSADCHRFVEEAVAHYGRLDVLVNNVGVGIGGGRVEQLDEAVWDQVLDVNLKSAVMMTKYALPHLLAHGRGAIVNIASVAGLRAHGGGVAYGASKAGMVQMTRELAVMYGREGVRANVVAPGHIFTPMVAAHLDGAARAVRRKVAPLGVEGDAWDVATACLFLASDEARFITGVCLPVDGGVVEIGPLAAHGLVTAT
jgi:NAD(P)-dependent dehydrogenase (short-subunit alcohol dehydrogenase family)